MLTMYHGTANPAVVINALVGNGKIRTGFHLTPDINVARNYGRVVKVVLEDDIKHAHVGLINKEGNYNAAVGHGVEVVLTTEAAVNAMYDVLVDAVAA
jgi:hypothetical protein